MNRFSRSSEIPTKYPRSHFYALSSQTRWTFLCRAPSLTLRARCQVLCSQVFVLGFRAKLLEFFSASSTKAASTFRSHIFPCLSRVFSLKVELKRRARKRESAPVQLGTHFSIRQAIYCWLSIVRCWQIPHIFSYPAPWNPGPLQNSRRIVPERLRLTLGARTETNATWKYFFSLI